MYIASRAGCAHARHLAAHLQGRALPLSVSGLLQHETKLSVVNFSVRKSASYEEPLPNKAELLILTGVRWVRRGLSVMTGSPFCAL